MYVYMLIDIRTLCMNLMNVVISILCFVSDCAFFYKLNANCIFYLTVTGDLTSVSLPVATVDSSSDEQVTPARRYYKTPVATKLPL
jgi:hypothetical protein